MHIGLIGGIGPAATDVYYRGLIKRFAAAGQDLDLTIVHADTRTLLGNLLSDNQEEQSAIFERLTDRLKTAGAECVVVTSIAGHFAIQTFTPRSTLPVLDIIEAINDFTRAKGFDKIGVIGTKPVMASKFYGDVTAAEVLAPEGGDLEAVHNAYAEMATKGFVTDAQIAIFDKACTDLIARGAEAVYLGGTDLALVYSEDEARFPIIDCAEIHINAIAKAALT